MIYLDYNATTPPAPEVKESIIRSLDVFGNPSSHHKYGEEARRLIETARRRVADLIGCAPDEIIFTSGGTESNNIALLGYASRFRSGNIITSSIEHPAIIKPLEKLRRDGFDITFAPISSKGEVDPAFISQAVRKDTILISVMHSNNETGVIQPIKEIREIARTHNIPLHTDASQSVGKVHLDIKDLGVDMLTIAGHKFHGPKGVGALYIKKGVEVNPVIYGASQEKGLSAGTENIPGIAGMGTASAIAGRDMEERRNRSAELRDNLLKGLLENIEGLKVNGDQNICLPNTLNVSIPGVRANDLILLLKDVIAFSSGAACHAGLHEPSHVLTAMGLAFDEAISSIRLSTGIFNSEDEIKEAVPALSSAVKKLRSR